MFSEIFSYFPTVVVRLKALFQDNWTKQIRNVCIQHTHIVNIACHWVKTSWRHVSCRVSGRRCRDSEAKAFNDSVKCFSPSAEVSSTSLDLLTVFIVFLFIEFMEVIARWAQQFLLIYPKLLIHSFCPINKHLLNCLSGLISAQ